MDKHHGPMYYSQSQEVAQSYVAYTPTLTNMEMPS